MGKISSLLWDVLKRTKLNRQHADWCNVMVMSGKYQHLQQPNLYLVKIHLIIRRYHSFYYGLVDYRIILYV